MISSLTTAATDSDIGCGARAGAGAAVGATLAAGGACRRGGLAARGAGGLGAQGQGGGGEQHGDGGAARQGARDVTGELHRGGHSFRRARRPAEIIQHYRPNVASVRRTVTWLLGPRRPMTVSSRR